MNGGRRKGFGAETSACLKKSPVPRCAWKGEKEQEVCPDLSVNWRESVSEVCLEWSR